MSEEQTTTTNQELDALGMSDEAFAQLDPSAFEVAPDEPETTEQDTETEEVEEETTEVDDDGGEDAAAAAEADEPDGDRDVYDDNETDDDTDTTGDDTDSENTDAETDGETEETEETENESETDDSENEDDKDEVDYKAEYERLLAPFPANGKQMRVQNVDEAIKLMQMGANYNKKMVALKPSLRTLKMLEKHELLDESKLTHLIDLSKGDKGAIHKLLQDNKIDPMDLGNAEDNDYRPNTYTVDDREVELDSVLDDLKDSPNYQELITTVSNKWDNTSRQYIANNPQALKALNDQMAIGIFQRVTSEVERRRAFGDLAGLSDLEAYTAVGDQLNAEGGFNDLLRSQQTQQQPPARRKVTPKPKPKDNPKLKAKKRAASSTKQKPASPKSADNFNPLALSDEEFEREFSNTFI